MCGTTQLLAIRNDTDYSFECREQKASSKQQVPQYDHLHYL
jgi:hypothetical protein